MDDTILNLWPIFALVSLILTYRSLLPLIKGAEGELSVKVFLRFLKKKDYRVLNNLTLYGAGYKSQIDHVVVSKFGIFVIETKNYKGWILGGEHSQYWTQVIFKRKEKLYNPIRQNFGHIKALKFHLSGYPYTKYIPIVVFTNRATLKVKTNSDVIYTYRLLRTMKQYDQVVLSDTTKDDIYLLLKSRNRDKRYMSIENLDDSANQLPKELCPECGSTLAIRTGRYGEFKGCKSFPRCRYAKTKSA